MLAYRSRNLTCIPVCFVRAHSLIDDGRMAVGNRQGNSRQQSETARGSSQPRQPVAKRNVRERGGIEGKKIESVSEAKRRKLGLTGYATGIPSTEEGLNSLIP